MAGTVDRPGDLRLGDAVAGAELPQPLSELKPPAAEAVRLRPAVATATPVLRERHGDDEFPPGVMRHYGILRTQGRGLLAGTSVNWAGNATATRARLVVST
jgi:hypothetical protein